MSRSFFVQATRRALSVALLGLLLATAHVAAQPFYVYTAPPAEAETDWTQLLAASDSRAKPPSPALEAALKAYQADPRMGTAIDVLRHYKEMSANKELRYAFLTAKPTLFKTLDAAKYELVMQTQRKMKADGKPIGYSWRVGSTGARHQQWLAWKRGGGDLNTMPDLDPDKQFQSDDDVSNFLDPAVGDRFDEAELLNGEAAAQVFKDVTRGYNPPNGDLHPGEAMVEFLSPTKAYSVMRSQHPDRIGTGTCQGLDTWSTDYEVPTYLQAWVSSNKEKYNGDWAVTQLDHWAYDQGVVTTEFGAPGAADSPVQGSNTTAYRDRYTELSPEGKSGPPRWPANDLFGWMSNQHRQVFGTHAEDLERGDVKYLQKYTIKRMKVAWEQLGLTIPPGYSEGEMSKQELLDFNRAMLVEAHRSGVEILSTHLTNAIRNAPNDVEADGRRGLERHIEVKLTDINSAFGKAANALAIAYSNLDPETLGEMDTHLETIIQQATTSVAGKDQHNALLATHLRRTLERTRTAGADLRADAAAFNKVRNEIGERINQHLVDVSGKTMDVFLLDVALGRKFVRDPAGVQYERALQPRDVEEDMRVLEGLGTLFGWSDYDMAIMAHEYFNQDLDVGIQMLQRLHRLTSGRAMQPRTVQYTDADGNVFRRTIIPSRFSEGLSFGLLSFKASMKYGYTALEYGKAGWDIYGKVKTGAELFENIRKIAGPGVSDEDVGRAHAQILTGVMGLTNVADHIKDTYGAGYGFGATAIEQVMSLSATPVLDDQAITMFALNFAKDLIANYYPPLAVFSFVYDASTTLYGFASTYSSQESLVRFIVENGDWEVDVSKVADPVLKGIYLYDGTSKTLSRDLKVLAKRIRDDRFAGGYHFLETSDEQIDPRAELLNLGRRNGAIDQFEPLQVVKTAIEDALKGWGWGTEYLLSGQKSWTEEYVANTLKVNVAPMKEDLKTPVAYTAVVLGPETKDGPWHTRRNTARLIAEFWVWQQQIIEDKVLPDVIKAAINAKLQEEMGDMPELAWLDEVRKLDDRVMLLDKKVWTALARSSDPYPGEKYDEATDINITKFYRTDPERGTRYEREALEELVAWVKDWPKDKAAQDAYPPKELIVGPPMVGVGGPGEPSTEFLTVTVRDMDEARSTGQTLLKNMTSKMQDLEGLYEQVLATGKGIETLVAGGTASDAFAITPYHVRLTGSMRGILTPDDVGVADDWSGKFKDERKKVRDDIWARNPGLVTPGESRNPTAPVIGNAMPQAAAVNAAVEWSRQWVENIRQRWFENYFKNLDDTETHPYFPYLTRLRYQIQKLENMAEGAAEMKDDELGFAAAKMQLDHKPVTLPSGGNAAGTIATLRQQMEEEYTSIIANLFNLVGVTLSVPDVEYKLLGTYKITAKAQTKDKPSLTAEEIGKFVTGYRWTVVSDDEIIFNVTTKQPELELSPIHSGFTHIQVEPVTSGGLPLGYANEPLVVAPMYVKGRLEVKGTLPDPRMTILVALGADKKIIHQSNTSSDFYVKIDRITHQDLLDLGIISRLPEGGTTRRPYQAVAMTSALPPMSGPPVDVTPAPGLLELVEPAQIDLEGGVIVNVRVVDLAGNPVRDPEITVSDNRGNVARTPGVLSLPLLPMSTVTAVAEIKDPNVQESSDPTTYDPAKPLDIEITLPIFEPGSLVLDGMVLPPAGEAPPITIAAGDITSGSSTIAIAEGGAFSYTNSERVDATKGVQFDEITVRATNHRLIRATTLPFSVPLKLQREQDPVEIQTEVYDVAVDPIQIVVLDWTRQPILDNARMSVSVGGTPAAKEPNSFRGAHTFKYDNEDVTLAAEWNIAEGPFKGETQLSISAVKHWETNPTLDEVQEIVLPVYLPGNVALEGSIKEGDDPLTDIEMFFVRLGHSTPLAQTGPFTIVPQFPFPRKPLQTIEVTATAGDHRETTTREVVAHDQNGVINLGVFNFGTQTAGTDHEAEIALLGDTFEKERDAAILACDYEKAAAAQRSLVDAVGTYLADRFSMSVPATLSALKSAFESDLISLEKAAEAERLAKDAIREATVQVQGKDWEAAAQTLSTASSLPDLPSCTQDRLSQALAKIDAKLAELEAKIGEVVARVEACELSDALTLAEPIAVEVPPLSWVKEEYPKIQDMAKRDEAMLKELAQARQAEKQADALAATDARSAILKLNTAIDIVANARRDAPECRQQQLAAYEAHLHAKAQGIAGGQPAAATGTTPTSTNITKSLLLVIDVSGSMRDQGKIDYAKSAAISTVRSLGSNVEVGLISYSGGCSPGGRVVQGLTTDKAAVESAIQGLSPGGGTPMAPAINFARNYLEQNAKSRAGQMIVLSDGQNDCGSVSDAGDGLASSSMNIKLDAVGLGLAEGSRADQDLQDLVRSSGGTQYSASNSEELVRAFRRASVFDQVKWDDPYVDPSIRASLQHLIQIAAEYLKNNDYAAASSAFKGAVDQYPSSPSAHHNYSLALEAEGQLVGAIQEGEKYLQLAPNAMDAGTVRARIDQLRREVAENPRAIFSPQLCTDLYQWARGESNRVRDANRKAAVFRIMTAAQRGDCEMATSEFEAYTNGP